MKTQITIQDAVNLLNSMKRRDPVATHALIEGRVPCNDSLASHESIQVQKHVVTWDSLDDETVYEVGLLGVLNGLFGVDENHMGAIIAEVAPLPHGILSFSINPHFKRKAS